MESDDGNNYTKEIRNLELIDWVEEGSDLRAIALKSGVRAETDYKSFGELRDAILEFGPIVATSPIACIIFLVMGGEYDNEIVAVRHSGRNIRRFLLREDMFETSFGNYSGCLDHLLSNNAAECKIEIKHLYDMAEKLDLSAIDFDPKRSFGRMEVDIIAALQLLSTKENLFGGDPDCGFSFQLGYCVGRLFSSAQNLATLEPDAIRAYDYQRSYRERGKKGKSKNRKKQRLDHLFGHICSLVNANPAFSRMRPIEVAKLAISDAAQENPGLWSQGRRVAGSQGRGQLENYLTCFASDTEYRKSYRILFPETG